MLTSWRWSRLAPHDGYSSNPRHHICLAERSFREEEEEEEEEDEDAEDDDAAAAAAAAESPTSVCCSSADAAVRFFGIAGIERDDKRPD